MQNKITFLAAQPRLERGFDGSEPSGLPLADRAKVGALRAKPLVVCRLPECRDNYTKFGRLFSDFKRVKNFLWGLIDDLYFLNPGNWRSLFNRFNH